MASISDYGISYEQGKHRASAMYPTPSGWAVYSVATGREIGGGHARYATEEAAIAARDALVTRENAAEQGAAQPAPVAPVAQAYTETTSTVYGRGRRYASQSGATYYSNPISGRYDVQIWDEA